MTDGPTVVYVTGHSRSGSTLLGNLLGQIDGFFHVGEMRTLWAHLAAADATGLIPCGCHLSVRDCPVWSEVAARIFSSPDGLPDAATADRWERRVPRGRRHQWKLLRRRVTAKPQGPLLHYAQAIRRAYTAVADVTGAHTIVDISKRPADALLLHSLEDVRSFLVHLVRDPRAVMHSWSRRELWPGESAGMSRQKPWQTAVGWDVRNFLAEHARRRFGPQRSVLVRYEDLANTPATTLRRVLDFIGAADKPLPLNGTTTQLVPGHVLAGNPSKFRTGSIEIREDIEWRRTTGGINGMVSTTLALPLLRRYGYSIRTR